MVREVEVDGDLPFAMLAKDIRRRVFLHPGTLLDKMVEQLERQRKRIETWLVREGYFDSTVRIRTKVIGGMEPNLGVRLSIRVVRALAGSLEA